MIDIIDDLLKQYGLTSKKLAQDIGISPGNVTDWRKGRANPSAEVVAKLADYFNVSTDYLLGRSDVRNPGETFIKNSDGLTKREKKLLETYTQLSENDDPTSKRMKETIDRLLGIYGSEDGEGE